MYQGLRREVEMVDNEVIHFTQDLVKGVVRESCGLNQAA